MQSGGTSDFSSDSSSDKMLLVWIIAVVVIALVSISFYYSKVYIPDAHKRIAEETAFAVTEQSNRIYLEVINAHPDIKSVTFFQIKPNNETEVLAVLSGYDKSYSFSPNLSLNQTQEYSFGAVIAFENLETANLPTKTIKFTQTPAPQYVPVLVYTSSNFDWSNYSVANLTYDPSVNRCIPDGELDDTLYQTDCCSGSAVRGSTICANPSDWFTGPSCTQICGVTGITAPECPYGATGTPWCPCPLGTIFSGYYGVGACQ